MVNLLRKADYARCPVLRGQHLSDLMGLRGRVRRRFQQLLADDLNVAVVELGLRFNSRGELLRAGLPQACRRLE